MVKNRGPGPAAYMLPTGVGYEKHNVTKTRRPQYSFGLRTNVKQHGVGPGPAAYNPDKLNRYGTSNRPAYSLHDRTGRPDKGIGPGPAGYNISGKTNVDKYRAPSYSLAGRTEFNVKNRNPGPNTYLYGVQSVKPGIPAFSMGKRTGIAEKFKSPGPAAYGRADLSVLRNKPPSYSLGARTSIVDKRSSPGPNVYDLKNYKPGDTRPAYSFGIRHGEDAPPMVVECDN